MAESVHPPQIVAVSAKGTRPQTGGPNLNVPFPHVYFLHFKIVDAESVNTFKTRLDKYWRNQPLLYDFKAELAGTGD